jgi:hypothetical protein
MGILPHCLKECNKMQHPESTVNFLERGGDGCELRVTSCGVKNFSIVFFTQFFKVLSRKPATRNPQQILVIF